MLLLSHNKEGNMYDMRNDKSLMHLRECYRLNVTPKLKQLLLKSKQTIRRVKYA